MQIERHVFGSYKGYTTLARSTGVTMDDCRVVERCAFGFGQTYENRYYKSLGKNPAFFTQQFPGSRRGLTRVSEGPADVQGRATLCYITLIVSRKDWDGALFGDIEALASARGVWNWDNSGAIGSLDLPVAGVPKIPSKHLAAALQAISHLEKAVLARKTVIASEATLCFEVVRAVEMLIPPVNRNSLTTAYRVLSPQFPAALVTLAEEAGSAATYRPQEKHAFSAYAQFLKTSGMESGDIPRAVLQYRDFGVQSPQNGGPESIKTQFVSFGEPEYRTQKLYIAAALVCGLILGLLVGMFLTNHFVTRPRSDKAAGAMQEQTAKLDKVTNDLKVEKDNVATQTAKLDKVANDLKAEKDNVATQTAKLVGVTTNLEVANAEKTKLEGDLQNAKKEMKEANDKLTVQTPKLEKATKDLALATIKNANLEMNREGKGQPKQPNNFRITLPSGSKGPTTAYTPLNP